VGWVQREPAADALFEVRHRAKPRRFRQDLATGASPQLHCPPLGDDDDVVGDDDDDVVRTPEIDESVCEYELACGSLPGRDRLS
jgi:hypothetical protein